MFQGKENKIVRINSRKYDGRIRHSWEAQLIGRDNSLLSFIAVFDKTIVHSKLGKIAAKTISYEYYWLESWFNIFRFHEPDGTLRNFYCNVNMPPQYGNGILDYVDLDLDLLVWTDHKFEVLDQDEFIENSLKYKYPQTIIDKANKSIDTLIDMIERKTFPFDYIC